MGVKGATNTGTDTRAVCGQPKVSASGRVAAMAFLPTTATAGAPVEVGGGVRLFRRRLYWAEAVYLCPNVE
jgi:hypothetical protein